MGNRQLTEPTLVIATHNKGKLVEIADLMRPFGVACVSAGDKGVPEPEETGTTFEANAELKALHSARATGLPALADDSGLCVAALNGDPGLYSARWAGPTRDFGFAMRKVEEALAARCMGISFGRRAGIRASATTRYSWRRTRRSPSARWTLRANTR